MAEWKYTSYSSFTIALRQNIATVYSFQVREILLQQI